MRAPRPVMPGEVLAIVSPASPIDEAKLRAGLQPLEQAGYRCVLMPHALDRDDYLAGSDPDRARDLMEAFLDPRYAGVVCSRGGYGCARLLPWLDLDAMAASGKAFLGFSDITTLHVALNRRGLATLYGPMPLTLSTPRPSWVLQSLLAALQGRDPIPSEAPPGRTVVGGTARAPVTGGCLSLLCDSLGTPESVDLTGKIVLIEDVDDPPHRVDAMLTHLLNSGQLARAAGIVVGEMTRSGERADVSIGSRPWRAIVHERLAPLGLPTIVDYPFGHVPAMLSLPLGREAVLDADAGRLHYREVPCDS